MNEEFQRHHQLGRHLYYSKLYERAVSEFKQALTIEPDNNKARLMLARALNELKRSAEACREVEIALENAADDHDALFMSSYVASNHKKALDDIDAALRLAPLRANYHCHRAFILGRLGRFPEAVASAQRALEMTPDSAMAHGQTAQTLLREANRPLLTFFKPGLRRSTRDEIATHVAAALRLAPEDPYSHRLEAQRRSYEQEYESALEKWREVLQMDPTDRYARFEIGGVRRLAESARLEARIWKICFRFLPWPLRLPLLWGLTLWSFEQNSLAFLFLLSVTTRMWRLLSRDWLQFVPFERLSPSLRRLKKPPLR